MTHSKKPWRYCEEKRTVYSSYGDIIARIVVGELERKGEEKDTTAHANALLMAAAPEMYDALVLIKQVLTDWNIEGRYINEIEYLKIIIQKAHENNSCVG